MEFILRQTYYDRKKGKTITILLMIVLGICMHFVLRALAVVMAVGIIWLTYYPGKGYVFLDNEGLS